MWGQKIFSIFFSTCSTKSISSNSSTSGSGLEFSSSSSSIGLDVPTVGEISPSRKAARIAEALSAVTSQT
jgi:hypothetical protein